MKKFSLSFCICAICLPVWAQDAPPPSPQSEMQEGADLLEQGARMLLRGLMAGMEPALKDMEQALSEMEPALRDLLTMMGDLRNYQAPEKLPNGDIIIRRKVVPAPIPEGEIEL